jgi:hypothetical protein
LQSIGFDAAVAADLILMNTRSGGGFGRAARNAVVPFGNSSPEGNVPRWPDVGALNALNFADARIGNNRGRLLP